jgi:RNA polymerase sigma factor (sigma-70 family)
MNEEEIVKAMTSSASKQKQALKALYYGKCVEFKRYFRSKGISDFEADDLVQEVIFKIFEAAHTFSGLDGTSDNSANAWLWSIARNKLNDYFDKHSTQKAGSGNVIASLNDEGWVTNNTQPMQKAEESLLAEEHERNREIEREICVRAAIEEFMATDPDRGLVLALKVDDWTIKDIAKRIGRTVDATKQYLKQCREHIRPHIKHCLEV